MDSGCLIPQEGCRCLGNNLATDECVKLGLETYKHAVDWELFEEARNLYRPLPRLSTVQENVKSLLGEAEDLGVASKDGEDFLVDRLNEFENGSAISGPLSQVGTLFRCSHEGNGMRAERYFTKFNVIALVGGEEGLICVSSP